MAYKVKLSIEVLQDDAHMFNADLNYSNMDYKNIVVVEAAFNEMLNDLTELGFQRILEKGLADPAELDRIKAVIS